MHLDRNGLFVRNNLEVNTNLNVSGISTIGVMKVGTGNTDVIVEGDMRVTGILSVGQGTITLDPSNDEIKLGQTRMRRDSNGKIEFRDASTNQKRGIKVEEEFDNLNVVGVSTINGDLHVDQIRRSTDNSANTKIQLNAGQIKLFAGNGTTPKINLNGTVGINTYMYVSGVVTATAFHGDLIGDVTGNLTGNVTGDVTGVSTGRTESNSTSGSAPDKSSLLVGLTQNTITLRLTANPLSCHMSHQQTH